ncbi:MAG: ATP-grasp domain-containing protein [Clostridia bacterium]|nr:ATP-grasp domain-containing protein [Clostridia bacterium]
MNFTEKDFIPVLFGNDINVYSVARAFYEEYGVKSKGFGKVVIGTCYRSKLLDYDKVDKLDSVEVITEVINEFAKKHKDKKILAIGCGDSYVKAIATGRENFSENVIVPYADYEFLNSLMDKERFYELCEKHGIDYPKTHIVSGKDYENMELDFQAPYILKPANQVMYYEKKFLGQKKVFLLDTFEELKETLKKTYDAGYTDHMIIQEFVPGDDTNMRVLTSYSDKNASVRMMCLGHVLLEEHTPYGIGNHAVIITEDNPELYEKFRKLLEDIGYTGFSNFDIKYDPRDDKYKAFEINTRQGRSNFYVTGSGHNVAKMFVEDFVYNREIPMDISKDEHLWMVVPKKVAFDYAPAFKKKMKQLIKEKKYVNPLWFKPDNDSERILRLIKQQLGHFKKFKTYLGKK